MNYKEFIFNIQKIDFGYKCIFINEGCEMILAFNFNLIPQKDYRIIHDFFSTARSLNLVHQNHIQKIDTLLKKIS